MAVDTWECINRLFFYALFLGNLYKYDILIKNGLGGTYGGISR